MGRLRIVLCDLRPESPACGVVNVIYAGTANRSLLTIPALAVHEVQNLTDDDTCFVSIPTRAFDPANPDNSRVASDHPDIPYRFD